MSQTQQWKYDAGIAFGTGLAAALVMVVTVFTVGHVSGGEARLLVEAVLPTSRFLCSSVMTATATTLALMLTLLGLTINAEVKLNASFYHRIRQIAFYDMVVLVAATSLLVVQCIPITESESVVPSWYSAVYYGLLILSALLGGAMIAIVVMLYTAIRDLIVVVGLDDDHAIRRSAGDESDDTEGSVATT